MLKVMAGAISTELDDQAELLEDFEGELDSSQAKLMRVMNKLDKTLAITKGAFVFVAPPHACTTTLLIRNIFCASVSVRDWFTPRTRQESLCNFSLRHEHARVFKTALTGKYFEHERMCTMCGWHCEDCIAKHPEYMVPEAWMFLTCTRHSHYSMLTHAHTTLHTLAHTTPRTLAHTMPPSLAHTTLPALAHTTPRHPTLPIFVMSHSITC